MEKNLNILNNNGREYGDYGSTIISYKHLNGDDLYIGLHCLIFNIVSCLCFYNQPCKSSPSADRFRAQCLPGDLEIGFICILRPKPTILPL